MKNTTRSFVFCVVVAAILAIALLLLGEPAQAENASVVYVSIREGTFLNGRMKPSTKSSITMRLFNGDMLEAISFDGEWVEVIGGESGTSYVKAQYLSELQEPAYFRNVSGGRVRVRKSPESSRTTAWVSSGQRIKISRVLLGWGYTKDGWVDLQYFQKEG